MPRTGGDSPAYSRDEYREPALGEPRGVGSLNRPRPAASVSCNRKPQPESGGTGAGASIFGAATQQSTDATSRPGCGLFYCLGRCGEADAW